MQAAHAHFETEFPRHLRTADIRAICVCGEANTCKSELANQLTGRSRLASFVDDDDDLDELASPRNAQQARLDHHQQQAGPVPIGGAMSLLSRRPCALSFLPPVSLSMSAALHGISLAAKSDDAQQQSVSASSSSLSSSVLQVVLQKNGFGNAGFVTDVKALVPAFIIPGAVIVWKLHAENHVSSPEYLLHHIAHIVQTAQYVESACGQRPCCNRTLLFVLHAIDGGEKKRIEDMLLRPSSSSSSSASSHHGKLLSHLRTFFASIHVALVPSPRQRSEYHSAERRVLEMCYQLAAANTTTRKTTPGETAAAPAQVIVGEHHTNAVALGRLYAALSLQTSQPNFYASFPLTSSGETCGVLRSPDTARAKHFRATFVAEDALAFLSFTLQSNFSTIPEWKNAAPDHIRAMCKQVLEDVRASFFPVNAGEESNAAGRLFASNASETIEAIIAEAQRRAKAALVERMAEHVRTRAEALSAVLRVILKARSTVT